MSSMPLMAAAAVKQSPVAGFDPLAHHHVRRDDRDATAGVSEKLGGAGRFPMSVVVDYDDAARENFFALQAPDRSKRRQALSRPSMSGRTWRPRRLDIAVSPSVQSGRLGSDPVATTTTSGASASNVFRRRFDPHHHRHSAIDDSSFEIGGNLTDRRMFGLQCCKPHLPSKACWSVPEVSRDDPDGAAISATLRPCGSTRRRSRHDAVSMRPRPAARSSYVPGRRPDCGRSEPPSPDQPDRCSRHCRRYRDERDRRALRRACSPSADRRST